MKIVIYIYDGLTMLDAIGPYEVLRNIPNSEVIFVAENKGEIIADSKFAHLTAKFGINEINKADILVIPGSAITFLREINNVKVINWIKKINETTHGLLQYARDLSFWQQLGC